MSDVTDSDIEDLPKDDLPDSDLPKEESTKVEGEVEGALLVEGDLEEEEVEEEKVEEEETPEVLLSEDFISTAFLSETCTIPANVLEFHHSFGYDCQRYFNLCLADENTVLFASGNLIHFFNIETKQLWFRRSSQGGGIGHIAKNPVYPHIAVGEKGIDPYLIIYEWPSMDIVCLLKDGTRRAYAFLNFSPDGELLCSQGAEPDYFLTVWDWKKSRILRQQKSYAQEVHNVMFSPYLPGRLTSSGSGHIKFWKMAETFTGLKLMGALGRFGKTEISDIIGFLAMPDEQVLSGCHWGNMLVWTDGLVKVEVCFRDGTTMHSAPISQIFLDRSRMEIYTIGMDGLVKVWDFSTIDKADLSGEDCLIKLPCDYTFEVGKGPERAKLMCMIRRYPDDPKNWWHVAQDANGGIWNVELLQDYGKPPSHILLCHAGPVVDMAASPHDTHIVSLGRDGRMYFYNYVKKEMILDKWFAAEGGCLLWVPLNVDGSGNVIISGFGDGVLRVMVVSLQDREKFPDADKDSFISLIQTTKPHSSLITTLTINSRGDILVSGGEDATIFVYQIKSRADYIELRPVGYVPVPSAVTYLNWKPNNALTLLTCCFGGQVVEMEVPDRSQHSTTVSYELTEVKTKIIVFKSVKAQIRRDIHIAEINKRKEKKVEIKKEKLAQLKQENPHIVIDEELYLEDSESTETLEPLYFPETPNPILFAMYLTSDIVWLSPAGYDAGYMYEYSFGVEEPIQCTMVADADDIEIHNYILHPNGKYLILAMQDGRLRVCKKNRTDYRDLSNYWMLSMHDNQNGIVSRFCYSYDHQFLFTCGLDGNIFSYYVTSEEEPVPIPEVSMIGKPQETVDDIVDPTCFSLEQVKQKAEYDRMMKVANERKKAVLMELEQHAVAYKDILKRNKMLPESQMIPYEQLEIDQRIRDDMKLELKSQLDLTKCKLQFTMEKSRLGLKKVQDYFYNTLASQRVTISSIRKETQVTTFRHTKLGNEFDEAKLEVLVKMEEAEMKGRAQVRKMSQELVKVEQDQKIKAVESWLKGINVHSNEFKANLKLQRILDKYYSRKRKQEDRKKEWSELYKMKPDENANHPEDIAAIEEAERTIGDFKLKSAADYRVPIHLRESTVKKYDQLLKARQKIFDLKDNFNKQVFALRDKKLAMIERITHLHEKLKHLHAELQTQDVKMPPDIPTMNIAMEFPEKATILQTEDILSEMPKHLVEKSSLVCVDKKVNDPLDQPMAEAFEGLLSQDGTFHVIEIEEDSGSDDIGDETSSMDFSSKKMRLESEVPIHKMIAYSKDDNIDTPWEIEMRQVWSSVRLYEQDEIIREINDTIEQFDKEVKDLSELKFTRAVEAKFRELNLLTLHQELIILKDFEAMEDVLSGRVVDKLSEKHDLQSKILQIQNRQDFRKREIDRLVEKEKLLSVQFTDAVVDNKFADFLKKIYKKKYKPPKVKGPDDSDEDSSSSSESSSDEEDDDTGSMDSRDLATIKLDESICPDGLDKALYDLTFSLRSQRHMIEQESSEGKKQTELLKKEMEVNGKKIRLVEVGLKTSQEELEAFQRKKQQKLNEVECTVLLTARQMQYFEDPNVDINKLEDKLVFSEKTLKRLHLRVGELIKETELQKDKHKRNKKHYQRMWTDCKHMEHVIGGIKLDIKEAMVRKFGREIHLDELEEAILRRLISDMRAAVTETKREYDRKMYEIKNKIRDKQESLSRVIQENTDKLNLLTVLEEEKHTLEKLLHYQKNRKYLDLPDKQHEYQWEVERLSQILEHQEVQMSALKKEIKSLSLKSRPLPPIQSPPQPPLPKPESSGLTSLSGERVLHIEELSETLTDYDSSEQGEIPPGIHSATQLKTKLVVSRELSLEDASLAHGSSEEVIQVIYDQPDMPETKEAIDVEESLKNLSSEDLGDILDIILDRVVVEDTEIDIQQDIKNTILDILNKIPGDEKDDILNEVIKPKIQRSVELIENALLQAVSRSPSDSKLLDNLIIKLEITVEKEESSVIGDILGDILEELKQSRGGTVLEIQSIISGIFRKLDTNKIEINETEKASQIFHSVIKQTLEQNFEETEGVSSGDEHGEKLTEEFSEDHDEDDLDSLPDSKKVQFEEE